MLCAIFVMAAVADLIPKFAVTVKRMEAEHVPLPQVMLVGAICVLIVGSLLVILGYKARWGALLLLVFLTLVTYYFHDFWQLQAPAQESELIHFMKNLGLGGAMVLILANGPGTWSVDTPRREEQEEEVL
jgi:putative oxidoreductase